MIEFLYIPIILFLYYRQYKFKMLIDDPVPRDGYLYELPRKPHFSFYDKKRPLMATLCNIGTFMAVCGYLHHLFGWQVALMYAVFPLNVSGVAWNTGNYYMSTVLLVLAGYSFVGVYFGTVTALFYAAALNSTISSVPFVLLVLPSPWGWVSLIPLLTFLKGKRLTTGLKQRKKVHDKAGIESGKWKLSNFYFHVPRTLAYYIYLSFYPKSLGFFHTLGKGERHQSKQWILLSSLLVLVFAIWSFSINPQAALSWFIFIALFSQFIIYGQFVTERYTFIPNVFFCILVCSFIEHIIPYTILMTLYFYRSLIYIPAWKSNQNLFSYGIAQFPECPENYNNLGCFYQERGEYFSAINPMLLAEKLSVGNKFGIYVQLASIHSKLKQYSKASKWINKALDIAPLDRMQDLMENRNEIERRMYRVQSNEKQLAEMKI